MKDFPPRIVEPKTFFKSNGFDLKKTVPRTICIDFLLAELYSNEKLNRCSSIAEKLPLILYQQLLSVLVSFLR